MWQIKALSNLVLPHSLPSFEQEIGLEHSWSPFPPDLFYASLLIFKTRFSECFCSHHFLEFIQEINVEDNSGADQDFQQNSENIFSQRQLDFLEHFSLSFFLLFFHLKIIAKDEECARWRKSCRDTGFCLWTEKLFFSPPRVYITSPSPGHEPSPWEEFEVCWVCGREELGGPDLLSQRMLYTSSTAN